MREPRRPDTIFWVEPSAVQGDMLTLDAEESHHLLRVHRADRGTPFLAVDGVGGSYDCVLETIDRGIAIGRVAKRSVKLGEPPAPIRLLVGLPDAGPAETVVVHAVPLGATMIDFVACARSGRPPLGGARLDRLIRIARSALKQSRRSCLPAIRSSATLDLALADLHATHRFVADPQGRGILELSPTGGGERDVVLAVGPPGGFSEPEASLLRGREFTPISLGNSRLSTETAAIALLVSARNLLK